MRSLRALRPYPGHRPATARGGLVRPFPLRVVGEVSRGRPGLTPMTHLLSTSTTAASRDPRPAASFTILALQPLCEGASPSFTTRKGPPDEMTPELPHKAYVSAPRPRRRVGKHYGLLTRPLPQMLPLRRKHLRPPHAGVPEEVTPMYHTRHTTRHHGRIVARMAAADPTRQ